MASRRKTVQQEVEAQVASMHSTQARKDKVSVENWEGMDEDIGDLGRLTRSVLDSRGWSYRQAQIQTGVSYNAVERMAKGIAVETDTLVAFARAIAPEGHELKTVLRWLRAGGKLSVAQLIESAMIAPDPATIHERKGFEDAYIASDSKHRELALEILSLGSVKTRRDHSRRASLPA